MAVLSRQSADDFEIVDEGHYTFEWMRGGDAHNGEPYEEPNIFYDPSKPDNNKNKKSRWSVVVDFYVRDNEDWEGEFVRMWFNPTMGTIEYPSAMRPFVAAALGLKADEIDDEADYDTDDCETRRFQAMCVHKAKKNGGVKAVLEAPVPLKRAGSSRAQRRLQAVEPPPVEDYSEAEFDEVDEVV
jgi:hypothetical protein